MRKFSLAYLTIPGIHPIEQIRIAAETGYDYVSLRTIPLGLPGEPDFSMLHNGDLFEKVRTALREYHVPLMDIELARIREDIRPESYEAAFEQAAALGATDVLGSVWTRNIKYYTEAVHKVAELAQKYTLNYNIEFLPWAGVRNLQEAITLVDSVQADNLFIMVDTLHAGRSGVTPEELTRCDQKYFRFMHICDGPAGENGDPVLDDIHDELMLHTAREGRLLLGQGAIDVAGLVNAIPKVPLSIELPNSRLMSEMGGEKYAKICLQTTKQYLNTQQIQ